MRRLIALAVFLSGCGAFSQPVVLPAASRWLVGRTATTADGSFQVRIDDAGWESGSRSGSSWNALRLRMSLLQRNASGAFHGNLPGDSFIEGSATTAAVPAHPTGRHWAYNSSGENRIELFVEVPAGVDRVPSLSIVPQLVRIVEWETLEFRNLGLGQSGLLRCGPFELQVTGEPLRAIVSSFSAYDLREEHAAYRARVPFLFLNHGYAMEKVEVTDARGIRLVANGLISPSGGSTTGFFENRTPARMTRGGLVPASPARPIAYPVTARLKMPKRFATERLEFEFKDVSLTGF